MWLLAGGAGLATGLAIGLTMHYQEVDAVRATELTVPLALHEALHEVMAKAEKVSKPARQRHVVAWVLVAVLLAVIGVVVKALCDVPDIGRLTDDDNGQPKE